MKAKFATLALIGLFAAGTAGVAVAHEDYSEAGSLHWLAHVSQQASTPETVKAEREHQKNWDRDVANHTEGVGGHGLYELQKMKPASPDQLAMQRQADKALDRGLNNHEEGIGGHGLYEARKGM